MKLIHWKVVYINTITIPSSGFVSIASYKPTAPTGTTYCFTCVQNYSDVTTKGGLSVLGNGQYLYGTPATITGLYVMYYFISNNLFKEIS